MLLFHETLYELQGRLFEINRDFGALKVGFEGLDPPAPRLMVRVYECVERSEEGMEAARRIAGELYGMMVGMGEGEGV